MFSPYTFPDCYLFPPVVAFVHISLTAAVQRHDFSVMSAPTNPLAFPASAGPTAQKDAPPLSVPTFDVTGAFYLVDANNLGVGAHLFHSGKIEGKNWGRLAYGLHVWTGYHISSAWLASDGTVVEIPTRICALDGEDTNIATHGNCRMGCTPMDEDPEIYHQRVAS